MDLILNSKILAQRKSKYIRCIFMTCFWKSTIHYGQHRLCTSDLELLSFQQTCVKTAKMVIMALKNCKASCFSKYTTLVILMEHC